MDGFAGLFAATFVLPVFVLAYALYKKRGAAREVMQWKRDYANYTVASLARTLGLQIVDGDPDENLYVGHLERGLLPTTSPEIHALLVGDPGGRRAELAYSYRHGQVRATLSVAVDAPVPPFEVVLRAQAFAPPIRPELGLPAQAFSDAALDRAFALYADDPRVAAALADPVAALLAEGYVHLQGRRGRIEVPMDVFGVPAVLARAELFHEALCSIAGAIDGRPAARARATAGEAAGAIALRKQIARAEAADGAVTGRTGALGKALEHYREHRAEFAAFGALLVFYPALHAGLSHPLAALGAVVCHLPTVAGPLACAFGGWWWACRRVSEAALSVDAERRPARTHCASCGGEVAEGDASSLPCPYCGAPRLATDRPIDEARAYAERASEANRRAASASRLLNVATIGGGIVGLAAGSMLSAALSAALSAVARLG